MFKDYRNKQLTGYKNKSIKESDKKKRFNVDEHKKILARRVYEQESVQVSDSQV